MGLRLVAQVVFVKWVMEEAKIRSLSLLSRYINRVRSPKIMKQGWEEGRRRRGRTGGRVRRGTRI